MARASSVGIVIAFALFAASCGSGDESGTSATSTSSSPSTEVTEITEVTEVERSTSTTSTTAATTTTAVPEVYPEGLHPLVADHNVLDAERVNIVFAAYAMPDDIDWVSYAEGLLTWDGPVPMDRFDGIEVPPEEANDLAFGLFAIEPFRSRRDLFNIWYLDAAAPDQFGWTQIGEPLPVALDDTVEVVIGYDIDIPPTAYLPSFVAPELPVRGEANFGSIALPLASYTVPLFETDSLPHEMSHAMFGFGDKYLFDSYGADPGWLGRSIYPSCAASQEQAESFFGDLIGVVDPAFDDVYLAAFDRYGIELDPAEVAAERDGLRVDYVPNGCFGPEGVSIKSTSGGLMSGVGQTPVLGAANRRWAEAVLDVWEAD